MNKKFKIICAFLFLILINLFSCTSSDFKESLTHAEELIGVGKYAQAAGIYKKLAEQSLKSSQKAVVYLKLGDLYTYSMSDLQAGLETYQKCVEVAPHSEAARLAHERRANIFESEGMPAKVAGEYATLLKFFPEHEEAPIYRVCLGEAYIASKEYQQAREELRRFVEGENISKDLRVRALFDIGETYFLESKPGKAIRFYYAFVQESPDSPLIPEVKMRIATCLEEMGYLGMAQKFAKEAAKDYPNKEVIEQRLKGINERGKTTYSKKKSPEGKSEKPRK